MDEITKKEIRQAVEDAFSASVQDKRYIDVNRIPLICQSIIAIDKKLDKLVTQDQYYPVKSLVYGLVGLVLVAVVGALLALVVTK